MSEISQLVERLASVGLSFSVDAPIPAGDGLASSPGVHRLSVCWSKGHSYFGIYHRDDGSFGRTMPDVKSVGVDTAFHRICSFF